MFMSYVMRERPERERPPVLAFLERLLQPIIECEPNKHPIGSCVSLQQAVQSLIHLH